MTPPDIKLHLFFARDSDRAVILRQGPSKQFRMILWHRDSDRFEDGQWLRHKVYPDRCALSPDGQHFLYFALDGKWGSEARGSYTAISRPPYFTALCLFPVGDTWSGGGVFLDKHHFLADGSADIIGRAEGLVRVHIAEPRKDRACRVFLSNGLPAPLSRAATRILTQDPVPESASALRFQFQRATELPEAQYLAKGAILYRRRGQEIETIRDFTDMTFEPIRAPYDWREQDQGGASPSWHPLDAD